MSKLGKQELNALKKVFEGGQFMRYRGGEGGYVERFEAALAKKTDCKYALTVNSGTSALICAMHAMGIGPGDEVIVPAFTWIATALAPFAVGAVPVLAEINESLTLDPADVEKKITAHTKAIIPVHMLNLPCDMTALAAVAEKYKLMLCEDACQSIGIRYKDKMLGSIGRAGVFSFNQFKNITCGEGGALLTSDRQLYEKAMIYHDTGAFTREYAKNLKQKFLPGVNYRVSEIHGAILGEQLKKLDGIVRKLKKNTGIAREIFSDNHNFNISMHNDPENAANVSIILNDRKTAAEFAGACNLGVLINSGRHVYKNWEPLMTHSVLHEQFNPYKWAKRPIRYYEDMCPVTLDILSRTINIGINSAQSEAEVRGICRKINNF